jgi:uncharacterized membrane protein
LSKAGANASDHSKVVRKKRLHPHSAFYQKLSEYLAEIQKETSATLAVVIHGSSGNYWDVAYLFGASLAWVGLAFLLVIPQEIHEYNLPIITFLLFLIGAWVCSRTRLRRWLTTRRRRRHQVKLAAEAAFVAEGVYHAPHRRGLLIYWSRLEQVIEVIADTGIVAAIPAEEWHRFLFSLHQAPRHDHPGHYFLEQLRVLRKLLGQHLPASAAYHADVLPIKTGGEG